MRTWLLLFIAILPVILIGLFVYKSDHYKESKKLLAKLFIFGVIICFPVSFAEVFAAGFFENISNEVVKLFLETLLGIALLEELGKWFITYKKTYNHQEFNHIYDIMVYSVFVSLGFACFENILYVFGEGGGLTVAIVRALLAVPGHACDAVVMGYFLGLAKNATTDKNKEKKYLFLSILLPTISHFIYDYCLMVGGILYMLAFIVFVIGIYIWSIVKIEKTSSHKSTICLKCGSPVNSQYCTNCGNKNEI